MTITRKLKYLVPTAIAAAVVMALAAGSASAEPSDGLALWGVGNEDYQEMRLGYQRALIEYGVSLLHTGDFDQEEQSLGIQGYVFVHAVDVNIVTQLLKWDVALPDGSVYLGLLGGYSFQTDEWLSGPAIGVLVDLGPADLVTEYQTGWDVLHEDQRFVLGLRIQW